MFKQNGHEYTAYPCRFHQGGAFTWPRAMFCKTEQYNNAAFGAGGFDKTSSTPVGYRPPHTDDMAIKDGGMGATGVGNVGGTGSISAALQRLVHIEIGAALAGIGATSSVNLAGGRNAGATIDGSSSLDVDITTQAWIAAVLAGVGALPTVNLAGGLNAIATIAGSGSIDADIVATAAIVAAITGTGAMLPASLAGGLNAVAAIAGAGSLEADILATANVVAAMVGLGQITAAQLVGALQASATIAGSGSITAGLVGAGVIASTIAGIGDLTAHAFVTAALSAALAGQGEITAAHLAGGMYLAASLAGSGIVTTAMLDAIANLEATIYIGAQPTVGDIVNGVFGAIATMFDVPGTMGNKINAAGSAGDPWTTPLPGTYPLGSAGNIIAATAVDAASAVSEAANAAVEAATAAIVAAAAKASADTAVVNTVQIEAVVDNLHDARFGGWELDVVACQQIYRRADGTVLARFNLFDKNNNPSVVNVYKRVPVPV